MLVLSFYMTACTSRIFKKHQPIGIPSLLLHLHRHRSRLRRCDQHHSTSLKAKRHSNVFTAFHPKSEFQAWIHLKFNRVAVNISRRHKHPAFTSICLGIEANVSKMKNKLFSAKLYVRGERFLWGCLDFLMILKLIFIYIFYLNWK